MRLGDPCLENELVRLELFGPEHRKPLEQSGAEKAMWTWMPALPRGTSFEAYADFVEASGEDGTVVPFAVIRRADDLFAGVIGFHKADRIHRKVRIHATWHPEELRGTLIFPATQAAMIQRALDWGARRIEWSIDTRNQQSFESFKRLGCKHEGTLRSFMRMTDGTWADHHMLSMVRDEARTVVRSINDRIRARIESETA